MIITNNEKYLCPQTRLRRGISHSHGTGSGFDHLKIFLMLILARERSERCRYLRNCVSRAIVACDLQSDVLACMAVCRASGAMQLLQLRPHCMPTASRVPTGSRIRIRGDQDRPFLRHRYNVMI